jgi:hypothetical protein
MSYRVVFDAAEEGYSTWPFASVGLVFILIGVGLVLVRRHMPGWWGNHPKVSSRGRKRWQEPLFVLTAVSAGEQWFLPPFSALYDV